MMRFFSFCALSATFVAASSMAVTVKTHRHFLKKSEIDEFLSLAKDGSGITDGRTFKIPHPPLPRRTHSFQFISGDLHKRIRTALMASCEDESNEQVDTKSPVTTLFGSTMPHKDHYRDALEPNGYFHALPVKAKSAFAFLEDNDDVIFVHGDTKVTAEAGKLVVFDGDIHHYTEVPDNTYVNLLGPFAIQGRGLSLVGVSDCDECCTLPPDLLEPEMCPLLFGGCDCCQQLDCCSDFEDEDEIPENCMAFDCLCASVSTSMSASPSKAPSELPTEAEDSVTKPPFSTAPSALPTDTEDSVTKPPVSDVPSPSPSEQEAVATPSPTTMPTLMSSSTPSVAATDDPSEVESVSPSDALSAEPSIDATEEVTDEPHMLQASKAPKSPKSKAPKTSKSKAPKIAKSKAPKSVKSKAPKVAESKAPKTFSSKAPMAVY